MNKKTFYKLSYGLYIVSSKKEDKLNGQIANTVFQITSNPPTVAVSINKKNLTCDFIRESNLFSVSILSIETPLQFIGLFGFKSGRVTDKFSNIKYKFGRKGTPIVIENSLGYLEVEVKKMLEVATHIIFVGEIIDAEILKDGEPLTYAYYHQVKRGATPVTAPTYLEEKSAKKRKKNDELQMQSLWIYLCSRKR